MSEAEIFELEKKIIAIKKELNELEEQEEKREKYVAEQLGKDGFDLNDSKAPGWQSEDQYKKFPQLLEQHNKAYDKKYIEGKQCKTILPLIAGGHQDKLKYENESDSAIFKIAVDWLANEERQEFVTPEQIGFSQKRLSLAIKAMIQRNKGDRELVSRFEVFYACFSDVFVSDILESHIPILRKNILDRTHEENGLSIVYGNLAHSENANYHDHSLTVVAREPVSGRAGDAGDSGKEREDVNDNRPERTRFIDWLSMTLGCSFFLGGIGTVIFAFVRGWPWSWWWVGIIASVYAWRSIYRKIKRSGEDGYKMLALSFWVFIGFGSAIACIIW